MDFKIFTDGGARGNPGKAAGAFVVYGLDKRGNFKEVRRINHGGKYLGIKTNNEAEYEAVLLAMKWLLNNLGNQTIGQVDFELDSNLVVSQLNGFFRVKETRLKELFAQVKESEARLGVRVNYRHVPREQNQEADRLVNEVLDGQ